MIMSCSTMALARDLTDPHDQIGRVSAASDLAKAMRYAIRHWPGLMVFLDDGRVEMDTNVASARSGRTP